MADVKKIMGVEFSKIKDIYDAAVSGLSDIMGIDLGGTAQEPSQSPDFVFEGDYTPPDGDDVDFF